MKAQRFLFLVWLGYLSLANFTYGQSILKKKGAVAGKSFSYYVMATTQPVKGIVFLLPGMGERPNSIFKKTLLPQLLAKEGYLTIIPELTQTLYADAYTMAELDQIRKEQSEKYQLPESNVMVGGFSAGGAVAVSYAENLIASGKGMPIKGVFAIDPPLDFTRLYASSQRKISYPCDLIAKEGHSLKSYFENALGGTPQSRSEQYVLAAPFTASTSDGGKAKFLIKLPIRLYTEPDLEFVRKTYCQALQMEDINAYDLEKLSQFLTQQGNTQAEYIPTQGRGFHSWNILEPTDCLAWIKRVMQD